MKQKSYQFRAQMVVSINIPIPIIPITKLFSCSCSLAMDF